MSVRIIEGTWDELERYKSELIGRHLRLIVGPEKSSSIAQTQVSVAKKQKVLKACGMFEGLLTMDEFLRYKHDDTVYEDRNIR